MISLEDILKQTQSSSIKLYLKRQQLQIQFQQIQLSINQVEQELLKLDGEERMIQSLIEKKDE